MAAAYCFGARPRSLITMKLVCPLGSIEKNVISHAVRHILEPICSIVIRAHLIFIVSVALKSSTKYHVLAQRSHCTVSHILGALPLVLTNSALHAM